MAGERTLNFGASETDARYQIEDTGDGADFVLARDTTGAVILLQYNATTGQWEYGGPVDLAGNDLSGVGVLTVTGDLLDGAGNVVYDQSVNAILQARLENDTVTVTAGDGLKNGGSVALGAATTLNIEPADFAGAGLVDDGADNLTVDTLDTGTFVASGGASPAVDTQVSTSLGQTDSYDVLLYVDADPAFAADYQWNYDHAHFWDDSTSTLNIDWTVNWDTDPGAGNDVTLRWEVIRR